MSTNPKIPWKQMACLAAAAPPAAGLALAGGGAQDPCQAIAFQAWESCRRWAAGDLWLARANCTNLPDPGEQAECRAQAFEDWKEATQLCLDQRDAREDLCAELGGGIYAPEIDPGDFVEGITNPYLMFVPGTTFVYEKEGDEEIEVVTVTVLEDTLEILGVDCTIVHDIVTVEGEIQEDTFDWFAEDAWGNVWYFGELSFEYEDGEIVGTGGSWKAGEDEAHPGIVMLASPMVGDVYRQEYLLSEAEDAAAVVSLDQEVTVPYGAMTYPGCLQTEDFSPLEPGHLENKYYFAGVGLLLEEDPETGARTELVEVLFE